MNTNWLENSEVFSTEQTTPSSPIPWALSSNLRVQDIMNDYIPAAWS
ncbi:MAG: hypothetical protein H8E62_10335, partial [Planctomycetes bacterium]|nr:hypothetical protein [Planctomycetota bacterium]